MESLPIFNVGNCILLHIVSYDVFVLRCISLPEDCNIPADRVEGTSDVKQAITIAHTDEYVSTICGFCIYLGDHSLLRRKEPRDLL